MKRYTLRAWVTLLCLCLCAPCLLWLTSCHGKVSAEKNAMTAVRLAGDTLTIEAALTDGFLAIDHNRDDKVYLFELPSYLSVDADLGGLRPAAEAKADTRLTFTLSATDGMRSRLYSAFLVASYDPATKRYTALTAPMALQNPESGATIVSSYTPSGSIKGLANAAPTDAIRLGAAHAVVDVNIAELMLSAWEAGAVPYVWNGTTAYLDGEALAALDTTVSTYAAAGVQVYLRLCLQGVKTPENPQNTVNDNRGKTVPEPSNTVGENTDFSVIPPAELAIEGAKPNAAGYAVDMTSPTVAVRMEGFLDQLAARYTAMTSATAPTVAFIIGYRVNDPAYHEAGDMRAEAVLTNYEKLVRMAHTALRSHAADGRVYLSVDDLRTTSNATSGWDVSRFLSAFAAEAALRGDFDWHVAAELSASSSRIWEEGDTAGDRYTIHTLGTLTDLLGGSAYQTPNGERRHLLISGFCIPAVDESGTLTDAAATEQAASYAYAHLTARHNGWVEALLYSAYTDADVPNAGLWSERAPVSIDASDTSANGEESTQEPDSGMDGTTLYARPICTVMRKMDTTASATLSDGLTALIGLPYTKLVSAMTGIAEPVVLIEADGHVSKLVEPPADAATLFAFANGTQGGFTGAQNLTYTELSVSEFPRRYYLHARFDRASASEPMPLTVTLPATALIGGQDLLLNLFAGEMDVSHTDAAPTSLTVRLTRPAMGDPANGDGVLLYEATATHINGAAWNTVSFPIDEITARLGAEDTVTLTLFLDAPKGESFELGLSEIYVTGTTAGAAIPIPVVIATVAVIAVIIVASVLYLNIRHRRRIGFSG